MRPSSSCQHVAAHAQDRLAQGGAAADEVGGWAQEHVRHSGSPGSPSDRRAAGSATRRGVDAGRGPAASAVACRVSTRPQQLAQRAFAPQQRVGRRGGRSGRRRCPPSACANSTVEQREHAGHEGQVLFVAVAAVAACTALPSAAARSAASGSSGFGRPSGCWRAYSSSCSQRCSWRRPSRLMAWPKLVIVRAERERGRIDQLEQVVGQRGVLLEQGFEFARFGVARQQAQQGHQALARAAVVAAGGRLPDAADSRR